jgi:hypothetical protein
MGSFDGLQVMSAVSSPPVDNHLLLSLYVNKTGGYCWSTPKCRNLGVQDAVFEGKKAEETSPRKSTSRTLKGVDQQYPAFIDEGRTVYLDHF